MLGETEAEVEVEVETMVKVNVEATLHDHTDPCVDTGGGAPHMAPRGDAIPFSKEGCSDSLWTPVSS